MSNIADAPAIAPCAIVGDASLYQADCRDVLRSLADNSIDSIVTDPPYALVSIVKRFGKPGSSPAKGNEAYQRASAGFMGKSWDTGEVAFSEEFWRECLRVLKPGGHVVAFSGTRTYHRMAVAIEDAGFEIRDQLGWLYGSGFPKSHDVSKGIDKATVRDLRTGELVFGRDTAALRVVCRYIRAKMDGKGIKSKHLTEHFDGCHPRLIDHWAARDTDSQPACPTWEQWQTLKAVLSLDEEMDSEVWRLNGRKGKPGDAFVEREVLAEVEGTRLAVAPGQENDRSSTTLEVTAANTEAARQWRGWGTALKPAWEPICLARKPLDGTVAENVLQHGTGAINIDGTRVKGGDEHALGRWPANIVHDGSDEVLAAFPNTKSGKPSGVKAGNNNNVYGQFAGGVPVTGFGDEGSAARFFYCAKASRKDRDEGLEGADKATTSDGPAIAADNAYQRGKTLRANTHPTVKPTDLMRWLCRLVTPPGGVILDPFMGSGSTGKAALLEGFRFIGCEREDEYMPIAQARIAAALRPVAAKAQPANDNQLPVQASLFGDAA